MLGITIFIQQVPYLNFSHKIWKKKLNDKKSLSMKFSDTVKKMQSFENLGAILQSSFLKTYRNLHFVYYVYSKSNRFEYFFFHEDVLKKRI